MRPCNCGNCRLCELFANDLRYRKLWSGTPIQLWQSGRGIGDQLGALCVAHSAALENPDTLVQFRSHQLDWCNCFDVKCELLPPGIGGDFKDVNVNYEIECKSKCGSIPGMGGMPRYRRYANNANVKEITVPQLKESPVSPYAGAIVLGVKSHYNRS